RGSGAQQVGDAGDARAEAAVGGRAVGHTGTGLGEAADVLVAQVDAVGEPDVRSEPAEAVQVRHGRGAHLLAAVFLLVQRFGEVGVQPYAHLAGQFGGDAQQVG